MSEVLLAYGPFLFFATAPSFERLKSTAAFRLAEQPRLGRDVAQQFLGPGTRTVSIDGVLYPEAFGGSQLLPAMQAAARTGAAYPLIAMSDSGLGADVFGLWITEQIQNQREFFGSRGARKITFEITLKAYGEDGSGFGGGVF